MNITMRFSHLAACCLGALASGLACAAISLAPPSLPPCAFADTESSSNFVFCTGTGLDRNWILSVEADVTSNNNVQVEFGVDRDGDGALSVDERELTVGWDCGEWVLRDRRGDAERAVCHRAAEAVETRFRSFHLYHQEVDALRRGADHFYIADYWVHVLSSLQKRGYENHIPFFLIQFNSLCREWQDYMTR